MAVVTLLCGWNSGLWRKEQEPQYLVLKSRTAFAQAAHRPRLRLRLAKARAEPQERCGPGPSWVNDCVQPVPKPRRRQRNRSPTSVAPHAGTCLESANDSPNVGYRVPAPGRGADSHCRSTARTRGHRSAIRKYVPEPARAAAEHNLEMPVDPERIQRPGTGFLIAYDGESPTMGSRAQPARIPAQRVQILAAAANHPRCATGTITGHETQLS
jgi:hypothetical protein